MSGKKVADLKFEPEPESCPACPPSGFCDLNCVMGWSDVIDDSDATPPTDRTPGRWCSVCGQWGNHHTERHDEHGFDLPRLWSGDQA